MASRLAAMLRPVYSAVCRHGGKMYPKPALIIVPTRRETRSTAVDLLTLAHADRQFDRFMHMNPKEESLQQLLNRISDSSLKETLSKGVGFYHEGTSPSDVKIVEELFETGIVQVRRTHWNIPNLRFCLGPHRSAYSVLSNQRSYLFARDHGYSIL